MAILSVFFYLCLCFLCVSAQIPSSATFNDLSPPLLPGRNLGVLDLLNLAQRRIVGAPVLSPALLGAATFSAPQPISQPVPQLVPQPVPQPAPYNAAQNSVNNIQRMPYENVHPSMYQHNNNFNQNYYGGNPYNPAGMGGGVRTLETAINGNVAAEQMVIGPNGFGSNLKYSTPIISSDSNRSFGGNSLTPITQNPQGVSISTGSGMKALGNLASVYQAFYSENGLVNGLDSSNLNNNGKEDANNGTELVSSTNTSERSVDDNNKNTDIVKGVDADEQLDDITTNENYIGDKKVGGMKNDEDSNMLEFDLPAEQPTFTTSTGEVPTTAAPTGDVTASTFEESTTAKTTTLRPLITATATAATRQKGISTGMPITGATSSSTASTRGDSTSMTNTKNSQGQGNSTSYNNNNAAHPQQELSFNGNGHNGANNQMYGNNDASNAYLQNKLGTTNGSIVPNAYDNVTIGGPISRPATPPIYIGQPVVQNNINGLGTSGTAQPPIEPANPLAGVLGAVGNNPLLDGTNSLFNGAQDLNSRIYNGSKKLTSLLNDFNNYKEHNKDDTLVQFLNKLDDATKIAADESGTKNNILGTGNSDKNTNSGGNSAQNPFDFSSFEKALPEEVRQQISPGQKDQLQGLSTAAASFFDMAVDFLGRAPKNGNINAPGNNLSQIQRQFYNGEVPSPVNGGVNAPMYNGNGQYAYNQPPQQQYAQRQQPYTQQQQQYSPQQPQYAKQQQQYSQQQQRQYAQQQQAQQYHQQLDRRAEQYINPQQQQIQLMQQQYRSANQYPQQQQQLQQYGGAQQMPQQQHPQYRQAQQVQHRTLAQLYEQSKQQAEPQLNALAASARKLQDSFLEDDADGGDDQKRDQPSTQRTAQQTQQQRNQLRNQAHQQFQQPNQQYQQPNQQQYQQPSQQQYQQPNQQQYQQPNQQQYQQPNQQQYQQPNQQQYQQPNQQQYQQPNQQQYQQPNQQQYQQPNQQQYQQPNQQQYQQTNQQQYQQQYRQQNQTQPASCYREDVTLVDKPFLVLTETSVASCQAQCQAIISCKFFSVRLQQNMCYLFNSFNGLKSAPGIIAGPQFCPENTQGANSNQIVQPVSDGDNSTLSGMQNDNYVAAGNNVLNNLVQQQPGLLNVGANGVLGSLLEGLGVPSNAGALTGMGNPANDAVLAGQQLGGALGSGLGGAGLLGGIATAGDFFKTSQALMEAGTTFMNAFPVTQLWQAGQTLSGSGFFRNKGITAFSNGGMEKQNALPPPGVGKPTVTCAAQGMTCCVPGKTVNTPPYLNGNRDAAECRAHFVSLQDAFCATTSYDDENCDLIKTETEDYIIYHHVLTMPSKNMNNAICECRMPKQENEEGLKPIEGFSTWEFSKQALNATEEQSKMGEKMAKGLGTAMAFTNMINQQGSQVINDIDSAVANGGTNNGGNFINGITGVVDAIARAGAAGAAAGNGAGGAGNILDGLSSQSAQNGDSGKEAKSGSLDMSSPQRTRMMNQAQTGENDIIGSFVQAGDIIKNSARNVQRRQQLGLQ